MCVEDRSCTLDILDTAGCEKYSTGRQQAWIDRSDVLIVVYDQSSRESFDWVKGRTTLIQSAKSPRDITTITNRPATDRSANAPALVVLVANKCDLVRKVSSCEGQALAEEMGWSFVESSAKGKVNIEDIFEASARRWLRPDVLTQDVEVRRMWVASHSWSAVVVRTVRDAIGGWFHSCVRSRTCESKL